MNNKLMRKHTARSGGLPLLLCNISLQDLPASSEVPLVPQGPDPVRDDSQLHPWGSGLGTGANVVLGG